MPPRHIVLGYHGCRRTLVRQVAAGKKSLTPSANGYDWLGHGLYFWADDPKRAKEWAEPSRIRVPGVLEATINLGYCL